MRIREFFETILNKINTKHFKRWLPVAVIALVVVVSFVTCSKSNEPLPEPPETDFVIEETPTEPEPSPVSTPPSAITPQEPEEEITPTPELTPVNPLTGLPCEEDSLTVRPIAIMINNIRIAQPQLGVSKADIIYEMLVEGGITRMLAIFSDVSEAGVIGSIRSARPYYIDVAVSYDAVYIHAGGSPQAYAMLSDPNITSLDGVAGSKADIFYRDQWRRTNLGSEHSMVTTGELIEKWLPTYDFRLEHNEDFENVMKFSDDGKPKGGASTTDFSVMFSSSKTTSFAYNIEDNLYYLSQYNKPYNDGNDNVQLAFTNVLILKTAVAGIPGDREGRLTVKTVGTGSGYFVCGGSHIEIDWSREADGQFTYNLRDGSELILGTGKTYVCVIPEANEVSII